jgi:hypothetical protein
MRLPRLAVLSSIAASSALLLAIFLMNPRWQGEPARPKEPQPLAKWLAWHPADWLAASAISDQSLDSALPLPRRIALWRSSYALAHYLAPLRPNPTAGFVRAGLFHWYELGPADRQAVLRAAAPLLRDPQVFASLHRPLWELTRDLAYLRRTAPPTINALWMLRELAVASGDFAEYRTLRTALRDARMNEFQARRATATIGELIDILPQSITGEDEPLVRAILEEIDRRPFDVNQMGNRLEDLARFAIAHDVQPLTAIASLVEIDRKLTNPTRARLAVALRDRAAATRIELLTGITTTPEWTQYHLDRAALEERERDTELATLYRTRAAHSEAPPMNTWANTCGPTDLCTAVTRTHDGPFEFKAAIAQSDEIPPYLEIYVDDILVAEGEVRDEKTFHVKAGPGLHRTEVRLVNRFTRNGTQRRARLS